MEARFIGQFLIAATLLFLSGQEVNGSGRSSPPNIILIMADDLGYGDLTCYGHPIIRTPNLDQMADEGIRLTSFYMVESSCTPSRAALLTGRYAIRTGMQNILFPEDTIGLSSSEITLAEVFKERNYRTMCVGKWHLGQARKEYMPTSQGFDQYYGLLTSNDMMPPWVETDSLLRLYRNLGPTDEYPVDQKTLTQRYTYEAIKFIKESKTTPFFLYLSHNMPHMPLSASGMFQGKSAAGLYGDVVQELDWSVGQLLKTLDENGLRKRTIVIFTSDNGPGRLYRLFKEGNVKLWHMGSPGLLRGHKGTSYEGGFRTPCIIRWPGTIPKLQVSHQMVTSMDLFTTLIEIAGGEIPRDRIIDGENVLPVLSGDTIFQRESDFFYFQGRRLEAVRSGDWKLRISLYQGHDLPPNEKFLPELYNLHLDPSERFNRADERPDLVEALKTRMKRVNMEGVEYRF